jgi:hypothetical protein
VKTKPQSPLALLGIALAFCMTPAWAQDQTPKYAAKVPPSILTPDTVQTRIGTLKFFDRLPDAETVQKVYDNLHATRTEPVRERSSPGLSAMHLAALGGRAARVV